MTESDGELQETAVDAALVQRWALRYLERYATSAENLRRVLMRRLRRHAGTAGERVRAAAPLVETLVARYRDAGLIDDAAYAAARVERGRRRGESLRTMRAGLAAKGIDAETTAAAVSALRDAVPNPDLAAACAFARRRRLGPYRTGAADHRRDLAVFARAGFGRREAEAVLACPTVAAVEAMARLGQC